jgi:hypothetical protein
MGTSPGPIPPTTDEIGPDEERKFHHPDGYCRYTSATSSSTSISTVPRLAAHYFAQPE